MSKQKTKTPKNNIFSAAQIQFLSYIKWNKWMIMAFTLFLLASLFYRYDEYSLIVEPTTQTVVIKSIINIIILTFITFGILGKEPKYYNAYKTWPVLLFMSIVLCISITFNTAFYNILYDQIFLRIQEAITIFASGVTQVNLESSTTYLLIITLLSGLFKAFIYSLFIFIWIEGIKPLWNDDRKPNFKFIFAAFTSFKRNFWLIIQVNIFFFVIIAAPIVFQYFSMIDSIETVIVTGDQFTNGMQQLNEIRETLYANKNTYMLIQLLWNILFYLKIVSMVIVFDGYQKHIHLKGMPWKN